MGAGRLAQINMIGTTNESKFDSWTTTLKGRTGRSAFSLSYVLGNSRAWGGQPTASYSGNGIAVTPEQQFAEGEWGPTRHDDRHRIVASGNFDLGAGFMVSPILQWASARPYTPVVGFDINGDGQTNILDRLCEGTSLDAVFAARGTTAVRALNPNGCRMVGVNSQRSGFVVNPDGSIEERSGNFFNTDLRVTKSFGVGGRAAARLRRFLQRVQHREPVVHVEARAEPGVVGVRVPAAAVALRAWLRTSGRPAVHGVVRRAVRVLVSRGNGGCGGNGSTRSNGETEFLNQEILRCSASPCEPVASVSSVRSNPASQAFQLVRASPTSQRSHSSTPVRQALSQYRC